MLNALGCASALGLYWIFADQLGDSLQMVIGVSLLALGLGWMFANWRPDPDN